MSDDDAAQLRALLGIDAATGMPTAEARQAVALIRHPHTPWTYSEAPEDRLGALMVSPLALNLRGTAWHGLLANELTSSGDLMSQAPDYPLAERARQAGSSIPHLLTILSPLIDLFDDPAVPFENFAPAHTQILFPALYEHAELWSNAFNEYEVEYGLAAEQRATDRVLESLTDPDLSCDEAAHLHGQFREAAVLLASGRAPQLLDGLRARDVPQEGWPTWTATVADRLTAATSRAQPANHDVIAPVTSPLSDEVSLVRRLRCGFRYWHVWGTYSQLYDELLTSAPTVADQVRGYLYIGQDTGQELIPLPELNELPLSGWELRTLFPELTALLAASDLEDFARTRIPTAVGLAPVLGEIAELRALATSEADLNRALNHLTDAPISLTHLSTALLRLTTDPDFNPEP